MRWFSRSARSNTNSRYPSYRSHAWRFNLEVVSETNQLDAILGHLPFQVLPVVAAFLVVVLFIDGSDKIHSLEPPFGMLLIPNGPHLAVAPKAYGFLLCHSYTNERRKTKDCNGRECAMHSIRRFPYRYGHVDLLVPNNEQAGEKTTRKG